VRLLVVIRTVKDTCCLEHDSPYSMGLQPVASQAVFWGRRSHLSIVYTLQKLHHNSDRHIYHLLLFFHVRPANKPTITGLALWHKPKTVVDPCAVEWIHPKSVVLLQWTGFVQRSLRQLWRYELHIVRPGRRMRHGEFFHTSPYVTLRTT
jgi:hypothetical protein